MSSSDPMMRGLRIAYLCMQAPIQGQASYIHVNAIADGLRRLGHEVTLYEPEYAEDERPGPVGRLDAFRRLHRRLAGEIMGYDLLYIRTHPFSLWSARLGGRMGIPVVQECNGPYEDWFTAWPVTRLARPLFERAFREQYATAGGVVAVTSGLARWIQSETGRPDIAVIPNGVDDAVFTPERPRRDGLPQRYTVFFGALAAWQGIEVILAAKGLPEWPLGVDLVVVGEGALRGAVDEAAAEDQGIRALGRLSYDEVPAVVANSLASLVVKTDASHERTGLSPIKLYESMACGVPVIVSDLGGLGETVLEAGCGLVVPPGDARAIAEAVARLSLDSKAAAAMGRRGRALAVAEHSWRARSELTDRVVRAAAEGSVR